MKYPLHNEETLKHVQRVISGLDLEKKWSVEVTRKTAGRTRSQMGLYWRWLSEVAALVSEHTGYEKDEIHELFKSRFLAPKIVKIGDIEKRVYSTKNLTTKEMVDYMDRVDRFCIQELAVSLPLPSEMQLRG